MHHEPADAGHMSEMASRLSPDQESVEPDAVSGIDAAPKKRSRSRDGKNVIFRVFPEEHDDIAARAAEAGLTMSEFIRRVVTGHQTRSRFDYDMIENLIRMHTDMNRLGNLFKMSFKQSGDVNDGATASMSYADREWQRSILESIEANQELLRNYIGEFTA